MGHVAMLMGLEELPVMVLWGTVLFSVFDPQTYE